MNRTDKIKSAKQMRLCVIGNLVGRNPGYITTQGLILAELLAQDGHSVVSASSNVHRSLRLLEIATTIVRNRKNIDLLILEVYSGLNFIMSDVVGILGRLFGIPMIFALHGGNLPQFSRKHKRWTKSVLGRADILVAPSTFLVKELEALELPIRVIRNIVDVDNIPFKLRRSIEPKMVWMRAFHPTYNPQMAIKVFDSIQKTYTDARLVMAGVDKGLESEIKKMVDDLGLQDAVRFPGFLNQQLKEKEFADADIYLNTNRLDNMPVAVIEACAFGLPVIATNVGGLPHLIEDGVNGILIPNDDVAAMVDAVTSLLNDPRLAENLSTNARKMAESSSWRSIRLCWAELFAEIGDMRLRKGAKNYTPALTSEK